MKKKLTDGVIDRSKYVRRKRDSRGKVRLYFQAGRLYTPLPHDESSEDYRIAYDDLRAQHEGRPLPSLRKPNTRTPRVHVKRGVYQPGTIGWLVPLFMESDKWNGYSEGTRYNYRLALDLLRTHLGEMPIVDLNSEKVDHYTYKIWRRHGGSAADQQKSMISMLWEEGKDHPEVKRGGKVNPTIDTKTRYTVKRVTKAWAREAQNKFLSEAHQTVVLAADVLYFTAQRGGDCTKLKWADLQDTIELDDGGNRVRRVRVRIVQEKTGTPMWHRLPQPLIERLDQAPRICEYILSNAWKRKWANATTLSHAIRRNLKRLGLGNAGYSMHGLRSTAARDVASVIPGTAGVKAVTGHKSDRLAAQYAQDYDQKRINDQVVEAMEREWQTHRPTLRVVEGSASGASKKVARGRRNLRVVKQSA